jgi:hypothetical protein
MKKSPLLLYSKILIKSPSSAIFNTYYVEQVVYRISGRAQFQTLKKAIAGYINKTINLYNRGGFDETKYRRI